MSKKAKLIIISNLILILFLVNYSIYQKEQILDKGDIVYLKLAPVDPRSLMQGDYMNLNYEITRLVSVDSIPKRGYCIISLDSNNLAKRLRFQENILPLSASEKAIRYKAKSNSIFIGAESFFFQEGKAEKYEKAEYGILKTDTEGNSLLIGLADKSYNLIN